MDNKDQANDVHHQLWLIYSQLKDAESDPIQRLELLERSRAELGKVLNEMNRQSNTLLTSGRHKASLEESAYHNGWCHCLEESTGKYLLLCGACHFERA